MKSLMGCLFAVVIFIILSIIGVFAFFTLAPQQSTMEMSSTGMESVSPAGDYRVEVIEHTNGEPFEVYYGSWEQETNEMSMLYIAVDDYANPSVDIEWQEENVADILVLDEDQEQERITLTIGEE